MLDRIGVMLVKELLQLRRDRWAMFRLVMPLIVQVVIYGYAATFTVHNVATAVLDYDNSQASREVVSHFTASGRFAIADTVMIPEQIAADLDNGAAVVGVIIHLGFEKMLANGQNAPLQVVVDGTNSNTALIALGYVAQIVAKLQGELTPALVSSGRIPPPSVSVTLQERPWFNEGLDDRWFFIPGVIGTLTLMQVVSLTAFAVVREREMGTLEQIMVSPISRVEFILGKTLPSFLIGCGDVAIVTGVGIVWFNVPFVGNPLVLLAGAALFLFAAIGLGLLLSTFSRTQQQAFALNFFLVNPLFILSGFAFPIAAMPVPLQWFTLINPLRYFLIVLRAVFLKGVGFAVLWPDFLALAALGTIMLTISVLRFEKSLD